MPANVCKTSSRHTRTKNGTCQVTFIREKLAFVARWAGSYMGLAATANRNPKKTADWRVFST